VVCIWYFRIAKLDKRIGNCTVLACNKWQEIFKECEFSLGVSGDAANDVFSAWNKLASDAFQRRSSKHSIAVGAVQQAPRRSSSLTGLQGRTVKIPVQLIPLERARAQTSGAMSRDIDLLSSIRDARRSIGSRHDDPFSTNVFPEKAEEFKPEISRPINLEESTFCCSYPSGLSYRVNVPPYAPQADFSDGGATQSDNSHLPSVAENRQSEIETAVGPDDVRTGIQNYVDKAFNTPDHPLGTLMNRIEAVYRLSYGGVGVCKFLLPHAIAETHSIIQRIHRTVR
jgi:amyotrophic lateral sclerosis 2 protein